MLAYRLVRYPPILGNLIHQVLRIASGLLDQLSASRERINNLLVLCTVQ